MNTPIYADLDQIVFDGRSKEYGAYQMRRRYNRVLSRAMIIAFLLFISITGLPKMIEWIRPDDVAEMGPIDPGITVIENIEVPDRIDDPEEPIDIPAAPEVPTIREIAVVIPNPTPEDQLREEAVIAEMADLDSALVGLHNVDGDAGKDYNWTDIPTGPGGPGGPGDDVVFEDPTDKEPGPGDWVNIEREPQAVNMEDLKKLIGYPPMAKEAGIEGKVVLRVLIDKYGHYVKHVTLKEAHPILNNAVASKIDQLRMTPGIQGGKPIKVWVTLPFDFKLMN